MRDSHAVAQRFGENLIRARRRAGISQEELGIRASLHRTQIGLLERGGRLPRIDTLAKLAGALEVPVGELFEGIAWRPGHARVGGWGQTGPNPVKTKGTGRPNTP
ncbi:MAG TPA: helix-turn-helix transcriptional regulator [Solirubrobacterales bacterium]|nr:helix-turn-helix transcriptional regulator [Solirubrobacterales bacterium]